MNGEWWNDFKTQLGKLNVKNYVRKFTPPVPPIEELIKHIEERNTTNDKKLTQQDLYGSPCANRLRGLLDILQYCFEKWIEHVQSVITDAKYTHIIATDSFFINFNYTDVLEGLYKIPEERVFHIHGRAAMHDHLIFGHGTHLFGDTINSGDEERTMFELNCYEKNPFEYLIKKNDLPIIIKDVEFVHIYGFSFSSIDEDYIDWIYRNTTKESKWEISWYSDEDKKRITKFIIEHWGLKDRLKLMQLVSVSQLL